MSGFSTVIIILVVTIFIGVGFAMFKIISGKIKTTKKYAPEAENLAEADFLMKKELLSSIGTGKSSKKIFCKHCGAQIEEDSKFCKSCGKSQE